MRLTCLKCGHQVEMAYGDGSVAGSCICGQDYVYPRVVDTGTRPNARAAERSRYRAFRAAGLVKNVGGFALGISLLGILCFPMAVVGAAVGIYVLTMLRGPVGRYSGRPAAAWAVAIGVVAFVGEGAFALTWLKERRMAEMDAIQETAAEDLRALLRAERLFRATHETYGSFKEFHFQPRYGLYTIYLESGDLTPAVRDKQQVIDPLPDGVAIGIDTDSFTAAAVANLDDDADLDIWTLTANGDIVHARNDATDH
jgi:hypothetical protein